jgi:hypothetical protein|tara:strand:+ start:528 stop:719 length:192 start_codon:yes stop_codon:yes gene_type:complete
MYHTSAWLTFLLCSQPLCLFPQEDFSRYKLLRWCLPLPSDLIDEYFCPRKNIVRVSSPSFANA